MSKLAAICAKLKGDAVTVNDNTSTSPHHPASDDDSEKQPLFPPPSPESVEADNVPSYRSPSPVSMPTLSNQDDSEIGVLKRKSIMPSSGASRRKKQRPAASTSMPKAEGSDGLDKTDNQGSGGEDDNQSLDGSERSLHIDLSEEKGGKTRSSSQDILNHKALFQQYAQASAALTHPNPGVLQALGLAGFPGTADAFNNIMASQSLAALAQQAGSLKAEQPNSSRVASPASVSGDSLNDSSSRVSLTEKLGSGSAGKNKKPLDHSKFLTRFFSAQECGSAYCVGMNYKEHFHCIDCTSRIIVKKEEMIRHYKWHKKREDSLQHGFMRYSPFDDCSVKFGPCAHNKKQTHYHCIQAGCNKVYVSTSDVQMHANYHRKASAIIMEGFQRFRATEDCGTPNCDFYSQRTTHFHCRRPTCNFTFKNKADMEKHKTYHQKDEVLAKDGFKKYMKYEHCPYPSCAYSKLSNHIHCMRPGCQYVLHSTSQLYPHKRKHEKKDAEPSAPSISLKFELDAALAQQQQSMNEGAAAAFFRPSPSTTPSTSTIGRNPQLAQSVSGAMPSLTTASDLLSTVARLSQGLLPMLKKEQKALPTNSFNPQAMAPQDIKTEATNHHTQSETAGTTSNEDDAASDSVSEKSEQVFDMSLNLTPGSILEPAAMNWKTEKSNRLSERAKSMMGHFKIASSATNGTEAGPSTLALTRSANSGSGAGGRHSEKQSELWRKYLTRYTANDPCNPRCWLLYKDHYHCNVEKCFNAFKNKDGVRDHARLHDNQEKISEQLFRVYLANEKCLMANCQYSEKTTHFHCKWMGCTKTIALDEDIFARLDHFQEHEFASRMTQATTKRNLPLNMFSKAVAKKRGRPPKTTTAFPGMINEDHGTQSEQMQKYLQPPDLKASYSKFDDQMPCRDELCKFREETHYHCNSPRCHLSTNRLDVMSAHSVNFHNYVQIPENYAYFDRNVNCRGVHCSNNRNSCHYHCLRPGCEHSFIRYTTVAQHDKRHREDIKHSKNVSRNRLVSADGLMATDDSSESKGAAAMSELNHVVAANINPQLISEQQIPGQPITGQPGQEYGEQSERQSASTGSSKTVKAAGTFFPKAGKTGELSNGTDVHDDSSDEASSADEPPRHSAPNGLLTYPPANSTANPADLAQNAQAAVMLNLLTQMMLLQQKAAKAQLPQQQSTQSSQQQEPTTTKSTQADTWQKMLGRMYASPELPCGNVFCKKRHVEHYHCLDCGSAFSKANELRLKIHIQKHSKYAGQLGKSSHTDSSPPSTSAYARATPPGGGLSNLFMEALAAQQQGELRRAAEVALAGSSTSTSVRVGVPDSSTESSGVSASPSTIQDMMMKALQLQVVGGSSSAASSVTTANGMDNQNNNFSDKEEVESGVDSAPDDDSSRFSMYHKYSKSQDCGHSKCIHSQICEHYHCLRDECSYSVNEQSKLPQHTKRHEKLDKIMGEDFKLYTQRSDCSRADCEFSSKSSHFHCLLCPFICTDASRIMPHRKNHGASSNNNLPSNNSFSTANDMRT